MKAINKIIRKHFHGFSDDQWNKLKNAFPYSEIPHILNDYSQQLYPTNDEKSDLREDIEKLVDKGYSFQVQYKDYENSIWTIPVLFTSKRWDEIKNDNSVKKISLIFDLKSHISHK